MVGHNRPLLPLDYTPASIASLDCFIDETWGKLGESLKTEEWHPSASKWGTILSFGIYFGEFLIRLYQGQWERYEPQPESLLNIAVAFPNGMKVFPVAKVWKRFKNGVEGRIDPLYRWICSKLNDEPDTGEWREWPNHVIWFMMINRPDRAINFFRYAQTCPLHQDSRYQLSVALQAVEDVEKAG